MKYHITPLYQVYQSQGMSPHLILSYTNLVNIISSPMQYHSYNLSHSLNMFSHRSSHGHTLLVQSMLFKLVTGYHRDHHSVHQVAVLNSCTHTLPQYLAIINTNNLLLPILLQ